MDTRLGMKKIPSASIILRAPDKSVLMMKRGSEMSFFPNAWVFPGGKLEEDVSTSPPDDPVYKFQALQELVEELGLVITPEGIKPVPNDKNLKEILTDEDLNNVYSAMKFIGIRETPPFTSRVFKASYFIYDVPSRIVPYPDGTEAVEARWVHPNDFIHAFKKGKIIIPPPILRILRLLALPDNEFIEQGLKESNLPVGLQTPIEFADGVEHIPLASYTAKPFRHTNLTIFRGDSRTAIVDPGWNEHAEAVEMILDTLAGDDPIVILTHHHKDHVAGLSLLEQRFPNAVVHAHPFTLENIDTSLRTQGVRGGEEILLTRDSNDWILEIVYAPGHTKGHICVLDRRNNVLIAGDHVVGRGTALLDPRNGNMKDYLETTYLLKELTPRLILPAHGPVIFSPQKVLDYYIKHRLEREQQVLSSLARGNETVKKIVADIYHDVDSQLWRYAGFNVFLHLQKLLEEGKVVMEDGVVLSEENYLSVKFYLR